MSETISLAPATLRASRAGDPPAVMADLYWQAAKLIQASDYNPVPNSGAQLMLRAG